MATYCQVSDVQAIAPNVAINAQSKPSDGDVRGMIGKAEAELEAVLANCGYVVPVAQTTPKAQVTELVAYAVLAKVLRARAFGSGNEADMKSADAAQRFYDSRIAKLTDEEDPYELVGATRDSRDVVKDPNDRVASFVEGLDTDASAPPVTVDQVF